MGAESIQDSVPMFAGKYRLLRMLGKGAMGEVWLAEEEGPRNFRRRVAVKKLLATSSDIGDYATESFVAEAQVIARLDHPNIVRLIELGSVEASLYLVLDFVDGAALDRIIKKGGALSPAAVAYLGREVARALEAVHSLADDDGKNYGVVHRDVSPSNILVSRDARVRLSDFGVARISGLGGERTETGVFKGKLPYMPPEQARGDAFDGRADIFSLAITLIEALTGKRLRRAETQSQLLMKIANEPVEKVASLCPDAPEALASALDHATRLEPGDRTDDAGIFAAHLDDALRAMGPGADRIARDELRDRVGVLVEPLSGAGASGTASVKPRAPSERPAWSVALAASAPEVEASSSASLTPPTNIQARQPKSTQPAPSASSTTPSPALAPAVEPVARSRARAFGLIAAVAFAGLIALLSLVLAHQTKDAVAPVDSSPLAAKALESAPAVPSSVPEPSPSVTAPAELPSAPTAKATVRAPVTPTTAVEEATGPGTLQIVVLPWADVSVDGRAAGTTPISALSLPPGPHTVVLRNAELGATRTTTVVVKAGKPTLLRVDLRRAD